MNQSVLSEVKSTTSGIYKLLFGFYYPNAYSLDVINDLRIAMNDVEGLRDTEFEQSL